MTHVIPNNFELFYHLMELIYEFIITVSIYVKIDKHK